MDEEVVFATRHDPRGGRRIWRVALSWMLQQQGAFAASTGPAKPKLYTLLPKQPHFPAKAKRAIFIYISGGPSTIDMFDPKPGLASMTASRRHSKSKAVL